MCTKQWVSWYNKSCFSFFNTVHRERERERAHDWWHTSWAPQVVKQIYLTMADSSRTGLKAQECRTSSLILAGSPGFFIKIPGLHPLCYAMRIPHKTQIPGSSSLTSHYLYSHHFGSFVCGHASGISMHTRRQNFQVFEIQLMLSRWGQLTSGEVWCYPIPRPSIS